MVHLLSLYGHKMPTFMSSEFCALLQQCNLGRLKKWWYFCFIDFLQDAAFTFLHSTNTKF